MIDELTPFLVCAVITTLSVLISLGFSLASLVGARGQTRTLALYTCARSLAFAVISIVPFANASSPWLEAVAVGMIILQALDAGVGATIKNRMKTFGPAGTAIANLVALAWLIGG